MSIVSSMNHIQYLILNEPKSFWEQLTSTAYWQVLLALFVAYSTYYFMDRSKRKAQLARAKSSARQYGYLLQQAYSNRLQSELSSNYYERMIRLTPAKEDKIFYREIAKLEAFNGPPQSIEISKIYGYLIEEYGVIEQLSVASDFEKIRSLVNEFVYDHKTIVITPMEPNIESPDEAEKYLNDGKKDIEKQINSDICQKNNRLAMKLSKLRLKFF